MTSEPVTHETRPARWRPLAGAAGTATVLALTAAALNTTSPTLFRGLATLSALLLLGSYRVTAPWFVARSETWHRVITFLPMTAYVAAVGLIVVTAAAFLPDQPVTSGSALLMIWIFHHIGGGIREPTSFAYERLRGRLTWAAALQVAATCCGTVGAVCLIRTLPVPGRYAPAVFATCLSVVIGLVVSSKKVFERVRKLATQLDDRAENLERCLTRLSHGAAADRDQLRNAAEDAWDDLHRTLRNKVETGFHLYGTFVLPPARLRTLEALVTDAIRSPGGPAYREATARLTVIRAACASKIDTVA
ncbi:hypothetical protein [Streptomyces paromomycinus]|uniref:Uncharacterized protein n=1 Tax=Streptomyces paromomycinus TaxID=92743 RepID=A0A401WDI2_STREY|nr:hypothetical protein [Streptomyces paromomycinus]GCD47383.1 hypothetical protein GKJPGBOP_07149 [Streptomyces paromomycinus]